MRKPGSDFVGSFAKGLKVLQAFDVDHASMTLSEVAERTGLDRAAARRFLLTLVELRFARLDGKRFSLTPRVLDLGFAYLSSLGLPARLTPLLERVSDELGESSSAAVLDVPDIVYVARVQTARIISVHLGVGARLPAATTSMGRVLLAALPPAERDAHLDRCALSAHTRFTVTDRAELVRRLEEVRARGFAVVDQELEEGLRSVAVPVHDAAGRVVAAINVSTQVNRVTKEELLRRHLGVLRQAAAEARHALV